LPINTNCSRPGPSRTCSTPTPFKRRRSEPLKNYERMKRSHLRTWRSCSSPRRPLGAAAPRIHPPHPPPAQRRPAKPRPQRGCPGPARTRATIAGGQQRARTHQRVPSRPAPFPPWPAVGVKPAPAGTNAPPAAKPPSPNAISDSSLTRMPYAEVLERFAQMADKPLVADTKIEGTLTFNDPRPYTYAEALDTLESHALHEEPDAGGSRSLPAPRSLQGNPPDALKILRGLDQTATCAAGEVVTVVSNSRTSTREFPSRDRHALQCGSVASLSRGQGLIITDRLANDPTDSSSAHRDRYRSLR